MAAFATDAIIGIKCAGLLVVGDVERVAVQTFLVLLGLDVENSAHALSNRVGQVQESVGVIFVLDGPSAVFVLQDCGLGARLHSAMTAGGTARAWPVVFAGAW